MNHFQLVWFDLSRGLPTALGVMKDVLGWGTTVRVMRHFLWRKLTSKPFRELHRAGELSPGERFTRHQLLPVLILDDIFREVLEMEDEMLSSILGRIVGSTGAKFIAHAAGDPRPEDWQVMSGAEKRDLANRSLLRFLNAEASVVDAEPASFAFDVSRCHFVSLCGELGRPGLASLFCQADAVLFGDERFGVELRREQTLASGGSACTFRFHWEDNPKIEP